MLGKLQYYASIIICLLLAVKGQAQQIAQTSQQVLFPMLYNPAVSGLKGCFEAQFAFRDQWTGIENNPTVTNFFADLGLRLKKDKYSANKHGLGINISNADKGKIALMNVMGNYAYHLQIGRKENMLSFGVGFGLKQYRINPGSLTYINLDDPVLGNLDEQITVFPDMNIGILYYTKRSVIGFSVQQVLGNSLNVTVDDNSNTKLSRHVNLNYSTTIIGSKKIIYRPSVLLRYVGGSRVSMDVNMMANFNKKFDLGASIRNGDAVVGIFRVLFKKKIALTYSYDHTFSGFKGGNGGSHEISISFTSCEEKIYDPGSCPIF